MMSSNSFNSSYQFADSLCYTASMSPTSRSLSKSYPTQGRPISFTASRRNYRRSYGWTSQSEPEIVNDGRKRQSSSFISNSSFSNLNYIDYDSDSDSDDDSRYDSDSGSTLNNDVIPSPSVLSEATIYSSTDNSMRSALSPKQRMVSFSEEVDIIKPPVIDNPKQKNILKKAFKIIKMKKKEVK